MAIRTENGEVQFSTGIRKSKRTTQRMHEAASNSTECSDSRRDRIECIRTNLLTGLTVGRITRELAALKAQAVGTAPPAKTRAPIGALRAQLDSLVPAALKTLQSRMQKHQDARVAFQVLSATGVLPAAERAVAGRPTDQDLIAKYRVRVATQLGLVALGRSEVYGSQLPVSREELDRRVRDASDARAGRRVE